MNLVARALDRFATWAIAKNPGGPYFGVEDTRWAWTAETGGSAYMTRILFPWRVFGIKPMLNRFHRRDIDRHLHNHPWKWAFSIVLCGEYDESRLVDDADECKRLYCAATGAKPEDVPLELFTRSRRVRRFNLLRGTDYHRINQLHGTVWTLFISGPKVTNVDWGFLVDGKHIGSREYLGRGPGKVTLKKGFSA